MPTTIRGKEAVPIERKSERPPEEVFIPNYLSAPEKVALRQKAQEELDNAPAPPFTESRTVEFSDGETRVVTYSGYSQEEVEKKFVDLLATIVAETQQTLERLRIEKLPPDKLQAEWAEDATQEFLQRHPPSEFYPCVRNKQLMIREMIRLFPDGQLGRWSLENLEQAYQNIRLTLFVDEGTCTRQQFEDGEAMRKMVEEDYATREREAAEAEQAKAQTTRNQQRAEALAIVKEANEMGNEQLKLKIRNDRAWTQRYEAALKFLREGR